MLSILIGAGLFALAAAIAGVESYSCGQHIGASIANGVLVGIAVYAATWRFLVDCDSGLLALLAVALALLISWIITWFMARLCYSCDAQQASKIGVIVTIGYLLLYGVNYMIRL